MTKEIIVSITGVQATFESGLLADQSRVELSFDYDYHEDYIRLFGTREQIIEKFDIGLDERSTFNMTDLTGRMMKLKEYTKTGMFEFEELLK